MCFGSSPPPPPPPPAPAPAPPDPIAEQTNAADVRKTDDLKNFGTTTPDLRMDRGSTGLTSQAGTGLSVK